MTQDVIEAAKAVSAVLAQENEALSRADYEAAVATVPTKEAAMAALGRALGGKPADASDNALAALGARLRDQASENQHLLKRAVQAQEKLIGLIVRSVTDCDVQTVYNGMGVVAAKARSSALAVSWRA